MGNNKKKNFTTRFLICSFIGLLVFSIIIFSLLGIYMSRKSKNTVYEIGNIYMSGMNDQMSRHFETVIKLRFDQVSGIVSVVQQIAIIGQIYMRNSFTGHRSGGLTI